jgi:hypothetical protein
VTDQETASIRTGSAEPGPVVPESTPTPSGGVERDRLRVAMAQELDALRAAATDPTGGVAS